MRTARTKALPKQELQIIPICRGPSLCMHSDPFKISHTPRANRGPPYYPILAMSLLYSSQFSTDAVCDKLRFTAIHGYGVFSMNEGISDLASQICS